MYGLAAAPSRLKSRKSFLRTVPPLDKGTTCQIKTQNQWQNYTDNIPNQHKLQNVPVQKSLSPECKLQWNKWCCLNRLRSGVGKTKSILLKWGYVPRDADITCLCGKENQTTNHLLTCKKLEQPAPWMTYHNVTAMPKNHNGLVQLNLAQNVLEEEGQ